MSNKTTKVVFWTIFFIVIVFAMIGINSVKAHSQDVLTKYNNDQRTGAFTQELNLTPTSIKQYGMRLNPLIPLFGNDARGGDGQPLTYKGTMILTSNGNIVRGTDLYGNAKWITQPVCVPIKSVPQIDMHNTNDHFGIVSTGRIDPKTGKFWFIATCSRDGSGTYQTMSQRVYSLDISNGRILTNNLVEGSSAGLNYNDAPRKQRESMAMYDDGTYRFLITAAGSFSEYGPQATGWMIAIDTYDGRVKAMYSTHAGIWETGSGPKIRTKDNTIYVGAGNGPYDAVNQLGEAALKFKFNPPVNGQAASFALLNSWAAFGDNPRVCKPFALTNVKIPDKVSGDSAPSAVPGAAMPMSADCTNQWADQDAFLTSTLVEDYDMFVGAGKDGITYLLDLNNFPQTNPYDLLNTKLNCAKLLGIYEASWDLQMDPCPANSAMLNKFPGLLTRHQHSGILVFKSKKATYLLFFAENSPLQAWRINKDRTLSYVARSVEVASDKATGMHGGMPGAFGMVTSNNGDNGIAWYSIPHGDANTTVTTGYLAAFDLTVLDNINSNGTIPLIWKSDDYVFNKFMNPIDNGVGVVLPNSDGSVMLYTLNK